MKKILMLLALISFGATACSDPEPTPVRQPDAGGTFTDPRDKTTYSWVRYGDLEWMSVNLCYATAGTVPDTTPVTPGVYDDGRAAAYYDRYGYLYTYEAALTACPEGWRLPTDGEWSQVGDAELRATQGVALLAGGFYNEANSRISDYDAYVSAYGYYWSATEDPEKVGNSYAFARKFRYNSPEVERLSIVMDFYLSVRCVRARTDL